jgi:hypothetical protein
MEPVTVNARVAAFAALHHGNFRLDDLSDMKVTRMQRRRRLESGAWRQLYDEVYCIAGAPQSWAGDLLAAVWAGGPRAVASHRSAAALWELPGARRDLVEITCPRWLRGKEPGLVVHEPACWVSPISPTETAYPSPRFNVRCSTCLQL